MEFLFLFLSLLLGLGVGYFFTKSKAKEREALNTAIREQNDAYRQETEQLKKERAVQIEAEAEKVRLQKEKEIQHLDTEISNYLARLEDVSSTVNTSIEVSKEQIQQAFIEYVETLEFAYYDTEEEFDTKTNTLKEELDKIIATRAATIQAILREKEIKEQSEFYKIKLLPEDLEDIRILEDIKPKLRKPEILSKLIWTTFYQKNVNTLCSNIIGDTKKSGIYKITDLTSGLAYVGQSVDMSKRWKDHIKSALGAMPAADNKLYRAMRESGLQNFTFEVLEETPPSQLNEKEKYYIELYQSATYGLNVVKGVNK